MKKSNLVLSMVIVAMIMLSTMNSYSQDWPQWRGLNRDCKVTGFKAPSSWPAELKQEWKVDGWLW